MIRVIDYKKVEMMDEEYEYYQKLVKEFTQGNYDGKEQFKDMFDTDDDGCITMIHLPLHKEIPWVTILFLQNLMLNQRIRRMEDQIRRSLNV